MTSRELFRELVVAKERMKTEHDRDITLAWRTANWSRAVEMPNLKDALGYRQSAEEQRAIWHQAVDAFGLKVRKHDKKRVRIIRMPRRESA